MQMLLMVDKKYWTAKVTINFSEKGNNKTNSSKKFSKTLIKEPNKTTAEATVKDSSKGQKINHS